MYANISNEISSITSKFFVIPLTDTDAMISADPNTFTPWHKYRPSSDLEAFTIRRLPCGRIVILKTKNT